MTNSQPIADMINNAQADKQTVLALYAQGLGPKAIAKHCHMPPTRQSEDRVRRILQVAGVYKPKFSKKRKELPSRLLRVLGIAAQLQQPFQENVLQQTAWHGRRPAGGVRGVLRLLKRAAAVAAEGDGYWKVTDRGHKLVGVQQPAAQPAAQPATQLLLLPSAAAVPPAAQPAQVAASLPTPSPPPPPPPFPWLPPISRELMIMQMLAELDAPAQSRIAQWLTSRAAQMAGQ